MSTDLEVWKLARLWQDSLSKLGHDVNVRALYDRWLELKSNHQAAYQWHTAHLKPTSTSSGSQAKGARALLSLKDSERLKVRSQKTRP